MTEKEIITKALEICGMLIYTNTETEITIQGDYRDFKLTFTELGKFLDIMPIDD
jgi:hypothetical protein